MSVSWGTQYAKLKTNLRLAANRLRLLQKKKTEQAMKARTEIAEFLSTDKEDRARIRVESIIREDFVVEAYELLEMFCELLLARFGLIQQMKELDDGIAEAVSSLLWVAPRIGHEVTEFKIINDQLQQKYGKQFAEAARMNQLPEPSRVSPKLLQKLSVSAPSKILVEKYLIEIARCANIDFTPDPKVMRDDDDEIAAAERNLINFMNEETIGWNAASGGPPPPDVGPGGNYGGPGGYGGPPPPSGGQYPGGGGGGSAVSYPQFNVDSQPASNSGVSSNRLPPAFGYMPSEEAPHLPPTAAAVVAPQPASPYPPQQQPQSHVPQQPPAPQQQQPYPPVQHQQPQQPSFQLPAQQPPHSKQFQNPNPNLFPSNEATNDSSATNSRKTSEHIYELPPDFLSQFPDPPTTLPGSGGVAAPTDKSKPSANDLDFDDLARRFKDLKKRL